MAWLIPRQTEFCLNRVTAVLRVLMNTRLGVMMDLGWIG